MINFILSDIDQKLKLHKNIGIFISGGFDSAFLSYLIHERRAVLGTDNIVQFFTVPKLDDSVIHSKRIIEFIDSRFNNNGRSGLHIVGQGNLHHALQVDSGIIEALERYNIGIFFLGCTKNPDEVPNGPPRIRAKYARVVQPFFELTKDAIVQEVINRGLTDIMTLSHTCTESILLRCTECWQCRERNWAFNRCSYVDPGTM